MEQFKVNLTSNNLANNLNDIRAKCIELAGEFKIYSLLSLKEFLNGNILTADDLNSIIEYLNNIASNTEIEDRIDFEYECGDRICDLDIIIDFINKLIRLLNSSKEEELEIPDDVYDLIVEGNYPKYVSNKGGKYSIKAYITKNSRIYSGEINVSSNVVTNRENFGNYVVVEVTIPENNINSEKTFTVNFSDLLGLNLSKSIEFILDKKEEEVIEEGEYNLFAVIKESGDWFYVIPSTKNEFTIKVLATINETPTKEGISCEIDDFYSAPLHSDVELVEIDSQSSPKYVYYKYKCEYTEPRVVYLKVTFKDLTQNIRIEWQEIDNSENVEIEIYSLKTNLEAEDTEAEITSDVFINNKSVDNDAVILVLEGNGEIISNVSLYEGKRLSTMSISPNQSFETKEYKVRAVYVKDEEEYISDEIIFTLKGKSTNYILHAIPSVLYLTKDEEDGKFNITFRNWKNGDNPWSLYIDNSFIALYSNKNSVTQTISSNKEIGGPYQKNIKVICDGIEYNDVVLYYIVDKEFEEILEVTPSSTEIKVGDTVEFTIISNSYQLAYELALFKFPESVEPYYSLRVEGNTMNILETDESVDIADSRNIKVAGYFIAPYEKLNAYTEVPNQIKYSLKAKGEGTIKVTFASYYGLENYVGASTSCTINVTEADSNYKLTCIPNIVELKVGGPPTLVRLSLDGNPETWELRWDDLSSIIENTNYRDCIVYPADTESVHEKLFTAIVDGKEYTATLLVITHAEEEETNTYSITWSGNNFTMTDMNPTIFNGGSLEEGSSWLGKVLPDNGYKIDDIVVIGAEKRDNGVIIVNNLNRNVTIAVTTSPILYSISWSGLHISTSNMSPSISNGGKLNLGSTWNASFVPDDGYLIINITYTGENVIKLDNQISISSLESNVNITVITSLTESPANYYTISLSGEHITTNAELPTTLKEHSLWSGIFTANEGYKIDSIKVNGLDLPGNTVTILDLTEDINIVVTTSKILYNISWSGTNVNISDNSTSPITKDYGSTWSGTFVPTEGYEITNILIEGNNVTKSGNTVNISNLTSNVIITIATSRTEIPKYSISWVGDNINVINMNPEISNGDQLEKNSTWNGTISVDEGYEINGNITTTGSNVAIFENSISISNLVDNVTITIPTRKLKRTITWTGEHANIVNTNPTIEVDYGSNWTGTVEVDDGYIINNILTSKGTVSNNIITINNITENVTINITTSEIVPVTINVLDIEIKVGEYILLCFKWSLSDSSVNVDDILYEIGDSSLVELILDESNYNYDSILGKVKGETTYTITINGNITGTANITVLNTLDGYESSLFANNGIDTFDIFGNRAEYSNGNQRFAIPENDPNGDYTDVVVYNDGYSNYSIFKIPTLSQEELLYITNNIEVSEDWLTATVVGREILVNVEPWYDKIEEIKEYANYDDIVGSNIITGIYNPPYNNSLTISNFYIDRPEGNNYRVANIILTSSDGSTLTIPIVQDGIYGGLCWGRTNGLLLSVSSRNIWKSVDWYGLQGTTFSRRGNDNFNINMSGGEHAFAVFHPYESVLGITGLPDIVVLDYEKTPYDETYSNLYSHDIE